MELTSEGIPTDTITTLRQLRLALLAGVQPEDIGTEIGQGAYRSAYRVADFVIKENNQGRMPVKAFRHWNIDRPRQWTIGKWLVQAFYPSVEQLPHYDRKLGEVFYKLGSNWTKNLYRHLDRFAFDLHNGNLGVGRTGNLVAYDWSNAW